VHFHDPRHEAGSRWFEGGIPLHQVSILLGHSNIQQSSTYLNVQKYGLQKSMQALDEARSRCKPVVNETEIGHWPLNNAEAEPASKPVVN
jgi:integrase-like protein